MGKGTALRLARTRDKTQINRAAGKAGKTRVLKLALGSKAAIAAAERLLARPLGATRPAPTGSARGNDGPPPSPPFAFAVRPRSAHRRRSHSSPRTASPRRPRRPGREGSAELRGSSPPRDGRAAAAGTGRARRPAVLPLSSGSPRGHASLLSAHLLPLAPRSRPAGHGSRAPKVSAWGAGRAAASGQLRPPPLLLPAAGGRGRGWDS